MFEDVAVPFVNLGNRRVLTDRQLAEDPSLREFVARFRDSFEYDPVRRVWLFEEPAS